jgi:hypothetical protein
VLSELVALVDVDKLQTSYKEDIVMMAKHEWRKQEKVYYAPKPQPEVLTVPEFQFVTISGAGNPNSPFFSDCITVLYAISYAIKMNLKKREPKPAAYTDYTVYPLEGIWDLRPEAQQQYDGELNKNDLVFRLMIRQPAFVDQAFFTEMRDLTKKKKPHPLLDRLQLETIADGKCVQMLHVGSYDDEPASFARMEAFAAAQQLSRLSKSHREIYLSDFRKVAPEKLKTVLRFQVA